MSIKDKIIATLDTTFEDMSEERLIDILLDELTAKKKQIIKLERENKTKEKEREKERIRLNGESMTAKAINSIGDYYRVCNGHYFCIRVRPSHKVDIFEKTSLGMIVGHILSGNEFEDAEPTPIRALTSNAQSKS